MLFDPAQQGGFDLDAPPAPWMSLGPIRNFERKAGNKVGGANDGNPCRSPLEQIRESPGAGEF